MTRAIPVRWLTAEEAAQYLAFASPSAMYRAGLRQLACRRGGGLLLWHIAPETDKGGGVMEESVTVMFWGKALAQCEGVIRASADQPVAMAALPNGKLRRASHGDYVVAMAIADSNDGAVLVELKMPPPDVDDVAF